MLIECAGVVTGSQAGLRFLCRKAWRFESSPAHIRTRLASVASLAVLMSRRSFSEGGLFCEPRRVLRSLGGGGTLNPSRAQLDLIEWIS